MMKNAVYFVALAAILSGSASAFSLQPNGKAASNKPSFELKNALMTAFTAATIATSAFSPLDVQAVDLSGLNFGSSNVVAVKTVREGMYETYEVDIEQKYDNAKSTFKPAKETKSKKGKYTAILSILVVGSFIIPMAQYLWYVKDDSSSDKFFGKEEIPEPEPPKKKGWF
uniref:Uncharacterized protein n=1 Tax=Eucampia antarctica TaxID=49252 RepID=A0A7S2S4W1_9STRA